MKKFLLLIGLFLVGVVFIFTNSGENLSAILISNANDLLNLISKQNNIDQAYKPADLVDLHGLGFW